jgi:hypothetical protein
VAICGFGLPACCCQPAVAGGVIYADLWGELSSHLALQALFTQSSPMWEPLLQAFSLPSTLGEVTLHLLSQACVFIYSSHGKWVFPPLLWSFPPTSAVTSFPAPGCWALQPSPARPGLFIYSSGKDSPPPALALMAPHPLCYVSLWFLLLITQFLFFPQVGVGLSRGLCRSDPGMSWKYRAPLTLWYAFFPSRLGVDVWRPGCPPGFSVYCEVEMLCTGWRCGGVKILPLLGGLACKVCLQCFSKISL